MPSDLVLKLLQGTEKSNMSTASLSFIAQEGNDATTPGRDTSIFLHLKYLCQMELLNE